MAVFTAIAATAAVVASAVVGAVSVVAGVVGSLGVVGQLALGAAVSFASRALLQPNLPSSPGTATFSAPRASRATENRQPTYQGVINQSTAPRVRAYGRVKLGGVRAFWDSKSGNLWQVVMMHHGEIEGFVQLYVGDAEVFVDGNGAVTTLPWRISFQSESRMFIYQYTGTDDQAANTQMIFAWPQWTLNHRLRGIANLVVRMSSPAAEDYLRIFPQGANTPIRAVIDAVNVLDTRNDTMAWSDNPALCIADYLTHPDGYGQITYDDLDLDSFNAFADLCDELVPLASGGTEKRYRLWGSYNLGERPIDVVQRMLAVCDGDFYTTREGKLAIRGGAWVEPTVTIGADDVISHDMEEGADALSRFNRLKVIYTDPAQDYQSSEAEAWDDLADQAERGLISEDFLVEMCPSPSQARRLAKIRMAKSNPRWSGSIQTNLSGLRVRGERTIRLQLPELAIDDTFLVESQSLVLQQGLPVGCALQVRSLTAAAYAWDAQSEEGQTPPLPQPTSPDSTLPTPENIVANQETRSGVKVVVASCDEPDRDDGRLEAEVALASLLAWEGMSVGSGSFEAVSGPLSAGNYVVRLRFRFGGAVGDWSANTPVTVT